MQVELRIRDTARRDGLRAHVERRLRFALSRFSNRVGRVLVRIGKVNEDSGINAQSCHIEARLASFGTVAVKDEGTDLFAAIDRAAGRIERLIARCVEPPATRKPGAE